MDPCKLCSYGHRKLGSRDCERHGKPIADLKITDAELLAEALERIKSLEDAEKEMVDEAVEADTKISSLDDRVTELEALETDLEYVLEKYAHLTLAEWALFRGRVL